MRGWIIAGPLAAALAAQDVSLPEEVAFGAAFEVVVTAAAPFDVGALAPLEVEVLERSAVASGERVRLRARCYELGELTLPLSPPKTLRVISSLPAPPGELEWPSPGYDVAVPAGARWWIAGLTAASIIGAYLAWRWASARTQVASGGDTAAAWSAAAAIGGLPQCGRDDAAWFGQLKSILRRHCRERFGVPAEARTSEELLATAPRAAREFAACLEGIDAVLFSPLPANADAASSSRALALAFVRATEVGL
ncbi:MAG: hypothetical protein VYA51_11130 [Planctomycetota bacterium]|nr:hypothetical protein [Planctomycetota bacterium]